MEQQRLFSASWKLEMSMIYVGVYVCFTVPDIKYFLEPQKSVIFELQLCRINHIILGALGVVGYALRYNRILTSESVL